MGRQIVNTGGQGLASSDAVKAAVGMVIVAAAILLVFFFLNSATKNHGPSDATAGTSQSAPAPAAT